MRVMSLAVNGGAGGNGSQTEQRRERRFDGVAGSKGQRRATRAHHRTAQSFQHCSRLAGKVVIANRRIDDAPDATVGEHDNVEVQVQTGM